jgi:hypothetical protein
MEYVLLFLDNTYTLIGIQLKLLKKNLKNGGRPGHPRLMLRGSHTTSRTPQETTHYMVCFFLFFIF